MLQCLLLPTVLLLQFLFLLFFLSSFDHNIFINAFPINLPNPNRYYYSCRQSNTEQRHYMFQWNSPFESMFNITNNKKPTASTVKKSKSQKEITNSNNDTSYDDQLLKLRKQSYGYTARRKPLNQPTRRKQNDEKEELLQTYENRIQILQNIIQKYNSTQQKEEQLVDTIKLLNNTILKLQSKINDIQTEKENEINTYKNRINILSDIVKQFNESSKSRIDIIQEKDNELQIYKRRIDILQDVIKQYNHSTFSNSILLQEQEVAFNTTIQELESKIYQLEMENEKEVGVYKRRILILQDVIQQYNETSTKAALQEASYNDTIVKLKTDLESLHTIKEKELQTYKNRIDILQDVIQKYNQTNSNNTIIQAKMNKLQLDYEKEIQTYKNRILILQDVIQQFNTTNSNTTLQLKQKESKIESLNKTIEKLQFKLSKLETENKNITLSNKDDESKLQQELETYKRRVDILQDVIRKYNETNTTLKQEQPLTTVKQLQSKVEKLQIEKNELRTSNHNLKLQQEKEIEIYKRRNTILQDIIKKYNESSSDNGYNEYKINKYKTKITKLETKIDLLIDELQSLQEENIVLKQEQKQLSQEEDEQIQSLQNKLHSVIQDNNEQKKNIQKLQNTIQLLKEDSHKKQQFVLQKEKEEIKTSTRIITQDDYNERLNKLYDIINSHEKDILHLSELVNETSQQRQRKRGFFRRFFGRIFGRRNKANGSLLSDNSTIVDVDLDVDSSIIV